MEKYDSIILGAGITGLFVGYKLSKEGRKVLIIEKGNDLGGLLGSVETNGFPIEKYYHHVFVNYKNFFELIEELGIDNKFDWFESTLGFYNKGKIYDLSTPFGFIWFSPLNIIEKIKFGFLVIKIKLHGFLPTRTKILKNLKKLDSISAKDWIRKNGGDNVYRKFFYPLLKSKYGENLDKVSASWFIERINLRTTGGLKKEKVGYIIGGFNLLIKKLEEKILENGGRIVKSRIVSNLIIKNNLIEGVVLDNKKIETKYVISTIPLPELVKFKELPNKFRKKLSLIKYQGTVCLILGLNKQLTKFYWTNIIDESLIGGIIEHTNLQSLNNYKDHIVYLASYPNLNSDVWKLSERNVFEKYFKNLKKLFPNLTKENIKWWKLFRDENAGIVYETGYQKKKLGNKTPIKGLIIGGMFNSYPERSIETSLIAGKEILKLMGL